MNLPSARPNEKVVEQFTVANGYTIVQVILALLIPIIFFGLFLGAQWVGITAIIPADILRWAFISIGLAIGIYIALGAIYLRLARHYFVTSERIIQVIGWLAQSSISIDYATITDMDVDQDILERFLIDSGTLKIDTAGSMEKILLFNIARPYHLRDEIFGYIEQEKKLGVNPTVVRPSVGRTVAPPTATSPSIPNAEPPQPIQPIPPVNKPQPPAQPTPSTPPPTSPIA